MGGHINPTPKNMNKYNLRSKRVKPDKVNSSESRATQNVTISLTRVPEVLLSDIFQGVPLLKNNTHPFPKPLVVLEDNCRPVEAVEPKELDRQVQNHMSDPLLTPSDDLAHTTTTNVSEPFQSECSTINPSAFPLKSYTGQKIARDQHYLSSVVPKKDILWPRMIDNREWMLFEDAVIRDLPTAQTTPLFVRLQRLESSIYDHGLARFGHITKQGYTHHYSMLECWLGT